MSDSPTKYLLLDFICETMFCPIMHRNGMSVCVEQTQMEMAEQMEKNWEIQTVCGKWVMIQFQQKGYLIQVTKIITNMYFFLFALYIVFKGQT